MVLCAGAKYALNESWLVDFFRFFDLLHHRLFARLDGPHRHYFLAVEATVAVELSVDGVLVEAALGV